MAVSPIFREYPAVQDEDDRIRFALTPRGKKERDVVYEVLDKATGISYIGRTTQFFGRRINQHQTQINGQKNQSPLYRAIRGRPQDFSVRIIRRSSRQRINAAERAAIKVATVAGKELYNLDKMGGGGGRSADKEKRKPFIRPEQTTPEKSFPLKEKSGRIVVEPTPRTKKEKRGVYRFKHIPTGRCYVGYSGAKTGIWGRIRKHMWIATKRSGESELYQKLREKPEEFSVGIIPVSKDSSLPETEQYLIRVKKSNIDGFNQNAGGGGSSS